LDACAVIALINREVGYEKVAAIFKEVADGNAEIFMHKVNLLEVYYGYLKSDGEAFAEQQLAFIESSCIKIVEIISTELMRQAGKLKGKFRRMSLADSFLVAQTVVLKAVIVTSDHHELDAINESGDIRFRWIR
jgi:predicted nucleic acid-binding protein